MGKSVAILQSNYIPWKGYFDIIDRVDEFILFDDMQYTRRDWRNRNKIKTPNGLQWLTIPVDVKGKFYQAIKDTQIKDDKWVDKHWKAIYHNYSKAPYFDLYADDVQNLYELAQEEPYLSKINHLFITAICRWLDIDTKITWSMDYEIVEGKTERLVSLCLQADATHYISGPAAKGYLDEALFEQVDIDVSWMDYSNYPEYDQLYDPFEHGVTVLDLLFNVGSSAKSYISKNE